VERVRDTCVDLVAKALVGELAVEALHLDGEPDPRYVTITLAQLELVAATAQIRDLKSKIQRTNPVTNQTEHLTLFGELVALEQHARALREQAVGGL
jgi:DNA primase